MKALKTVEYDPPSKDQFEHGTAVLQSPTFPKIPRVCQKFESGLKTCLVVACRSAAFGNLFGQNQLLPFQFFDPLFIGFDDCAAVGLYKTVHDL